MAKGDFSQPAGASLWTALALPALVVVLGLSLGFVALLIIASRHVPKTPSDPSASRPAEPDAGGARD